MAKPPLLALLLLPGLAAAQATTPPAPAETLNFCGVDLPLKAPCTPDTKYGLRCDTYQLQWMYLNYPQLEPMVQSLLHYEKKKHKDYEQQELQGSFILGQPVKGYRLSYTTEKGQAYELVFYGVAKNQPVLVQLTMDTDPEKTADLPELARQIVRLNR